MMVAIWPPHLSGIERGPGFAFTSLYQMQDAPGKGEEARKWSGTSAANTTGSG
jgi:hypothetical protein